MWIIGAWTVGIQKTKAIEYVNTYNSSPSAGFMEIENKVVLSHIDCKLSLSKEESRAIIELMESKNTTSESTVQQGCWLFF